MIITVANNKGGVGKTTLAVILAQLFSKGKKKVVVADTDSQQSSVVRLLKPNGENAFSGIEVLRSPGKTPDQKLLSSYECAIIDTPPNGASAVLAKVIDYSDAVVIPFKAEQLSLIGYDRLLEQIPDGKIVIPVCVVTDDKTEQRKRMIAKIEDILKEPEETRLPVIFVQTYSRIEWNMDEYRLFSHGLTLKQSGPYEKIMKVLKEHCKK